MIEDLQYLLGIETSRYAVGDTINLRYGDLLASLVKIDEALFLFIQEKYYYTINQELKVLSVEPYIFSRPLKCLQHNNTQLILTSNCILEVKDKKLIEKLTVHEATDFYSNCNLFIQSTDKQFKLNNDKLYQLNNDKLKLVKWNTNSKYYQFCDKFYVFENNDLFKIDRNGSFTKIQQKSKVQGLSQCGSILLIFNQFHRMLLFDMAKEEFSTKCFGFYRNDDSINSEISNHLELGRNGLKLKEQILVEHFGSDYSEEVEHYYNNYQQRQTETLNNQPKKLEKCQLMYVFKPLPQVDLYVVIENSSLFVVDKELNILKQTPINCEVYSGYKCKSKGKQSIYEGYKHQIIPCCGKLYIRIEDKLYVLHDSQLQLVLNIRNLNEYEPYSQNNCIFCENNELCVQQANNIYAFRNNQLELLREAKQMYFQCQSKLYSYYEMSNDITSVYDVTKQQRLYFINDVSGIQYLQGGILIVKLYNGTLVIADIINARTKDFCETDFLSNIVLGSTGIQFNNKIIEDYFGEKFEINHKRLYEELIQQQMQFPCYLEEIYKIVPLHLIAEQYSIQLDKKLDGKQDSLRQLHCKLENSLQKISEKINVLINIHDRIAQSWKQIAEDKLNQ
ncbi:Conserved_hypothetical protein [Hexamita inflata]|uniref:Uncharacterized protein n=1 Tax=Hexamita inflata TaxID=28002 RepID=A0AA86R8N9_9EUKA|nr:Conserved hypothetical protein [Hexamita inflata]